MPKKRLNSDAAVQSKSRSIKAKVEFHDFDSMVTESFDPLSHDTDLAAARQMMQENDALTKTSTKSENVDTNVQSNNLEYQIKSLSNLYKMRIKLQKILSFTNRLPIGVDTEQPFLSSIHDCLLHLFNDLVDWHYTLITEGEVFGKESSTLRTDNLIETSLFEEQPGLLHSRIIPTFMNQLDKYHRMSDFDTFKVFNNLPSAQIRRAISLEFEKLVDKTRPSLASLKLNPNTEIFGIHSENVNLSDDYTKHYYDDTRFYVKLLRHLSTSVIFENSNNAQEMASSSHLENPTHGSKNTLYDQRASKGRKTRYKPIPKLFGYMSSSNREVADEELTNRIMESIFAFG